MPFCLAIHGGCDTRRRESFSEAEILAQRAALAAALSVGYAVLAAGGASLEAVERTICSLEDCGLFDAGRGAYRNPDGGVDLDAAIMDGLTGAAGAAAHVRGVRNPIRLARRIMERTAHVLLVSQGAEDFARKQGLEMVDDVYFTPAKDGGMGELDRTTGTVGAVALDRAGHLAAGTSTGGIRRRHPGRVGDSPIIGAGTYADDATVAVSATGEGEFFLRAVLAHDIAARVAYGGRRLEAAATESLRERVTAKGGRGGVIALDATGAPVMIFNTPTMARGRVLESSGVPEVALFEEELTPIPASGLPSATPSPAAPGAARSSPRRNTPLESPPRC
jgi:beta-aspartyl-peptidase (threonine type)